MLEILCQTEKDMQRLGQSLGACMRAGDVVLLTGEMGAGKSVLTRAAARAMGVDEYIPAEDGASFIEWPQMAQEAMPEDALHMDIAYAEDGAARVARLTAGGAFDETRIEEIRRRLEADDEHFDD